MRAGRSRQSGFRSRHVRKAAAMPTQRWVIPEAEYARIRPARPKAAAAQPENARPGPALQITANGPASSHLLTLLTRVGLASMLPAGHPAPTVQDHISGGPPTTGEVTWAFADGSPASRYPTTARPSVAVLGDWA